MQDGQKEVPLVQPGCRCGRQRFFGQEQEAASDKASEALFQQIEHLIEQNTKVLLEALHGKETMMRVVPDAAFDNKHESTEQDQQTALDFLDGF